MLTPVARRPSAVELLAADPELAWRDHYLDPAGAATRLAAALGVDPADLTTPLLVRCKYRIGESVRVVLRFGLAGTSQLATARLFVDRPAAGAAHRRSPGSLHDEAAGAVWWVFPNDRKLLGVEAVMHPDRQLADALRIHGWSASTVAEYAPERSLTVRADDVGGAALAFVKLYAPNTLRPTDIADRQMTLVGALAGSGLATVPRVLGIDERRGLIALEAMAGKPWTALPRHAVDDALARFGAAIAGLHAVPPTVDLRAFGRFAPPRLARSAELVGLARPELAARLAAIARWLTTNRERATSSDRLVALHGDCHPKNALFEIDSGRVHHVAMIDLDQGGLGPAACDIASTLARLQHGAVLGRSTEAEADRWSQAFLDGYCTVSALPSAASMRWHTVAAIVAERAIRAVNRVDLDALARLDALIERAECLIEAPR